MKAGYGVLLLSLKSDLRYATRYHMGSRYIGTRLYVSDTKMLVDTRIQGVILVLSLGYIALNDAARCK